MSTQILAQRRACHALGQIQEHEKAGKDSYKNYVSYAESLPATILMNGLGQACASLLAKAEGVLEKPHGLLYVDLQSWLCGSDPAVPFKGKPGLMDAIIGSDQATYFRAQTEALAYLVWLKKFANAYLERGKPE
jgi:CRISPR-associated protein Cmr5